ncbi:MAG: three-Cys-motif partner protein TcmP [Candidatus Aquicultor sp.]|nr:three-Cys-motif partner protein TcmP [Candidatus Aquicultor sp.]
MQLASDGLPAMDVGAWAENKHYYLNRYCDMFAVGTSKKWPQRYYIDLFSGPGIGINRETGQESPGSPLIALAHPFTNFVFVEANSESLDALKVRTEPLLNGRHAEYILGDANDVFSDIVRNVQQQGSLSLIFVDAYTIQLKMRTMQWFSDHFRTDLLIHFPYGTFLQRVIPQTQTEMTETTITELNEFFGGTEWQELRGRKPNPRVYLNLYEAKLRELGYMIGDNYPRMANIKNATLYYLVLASKNELALKFWKNTNEIDPDGQRALF